MAVFIICRGGICHAGVTCEHMSIAHILMAVFILATVTFLVSGLRLWSGFKFGFGFGKVRLRFGFRPPQGSWLCRRGHGYAGCHEHRPPHGSWFCRRGHGYAGCHEHRPPQGSYLRRSGSTVWLLAAKVSRLRLGLESWLRLRSTFLGQL